jgi:sensor histidine kinase YesM
MRLPRTPVLIVGFWTLLGLLESSKAYVAEQLRGPGSLPPGIPTGWIAALVGNMPWWLLWAVLTPVVFGLARRFRLDGGRWPVSAVVHLGAAMALSLVHLVVVGALYYYTTTQGGPVGSVARQVQNIVDAYLVLDVMTYSAVVGAWYVLEFARRVREREVTALQLEARAASLETQMAEARLSALRMELNPHFLFNALNGISGLIRRGDSTVAVETIARLGDLLRAALDQSQSHEVPLERELEFLDLYLAIERARFPDRLGVELDVEPAARAERVPAFILQPIVENAVRHGIAPLTGPGCIRISASVRGAALVVEVSDTGPGFARAAREGGIGLANTRARLAQMYGGAGRLGIESPPGGGAIVTVTVPRSLVFA